MLSDDDFAVLNALYLKKLAGAATIAEATGLPVGSVADRLATAAAQGWVLATPGGSMLLEDGTAQVLATYREAYAAARADPALAAWYEKFEALNERFIGLVTQWQQTGGDERVEHRLLQAAGRLARDLALLQPLVPRYAEYGRRLQRSIGRVDRGERDYVCKPTLDSVHNIWFEFHEDVLAVLGRPRDTT